MQRIYPVDQTISDHLLFQTAFHEAGHATSIHLGNQQKNLPPVFFQIQIKKNIAFKDTLFAEVIDGCLIQSLPIAGLENMENLNEEERLKYQCAYEADIINLLVGPLAEAKYVSLRDDENFNFDLLNTQSLTYHGGSSDVSKAYAYLEYFIASKNQREDKMLDLFEQAFIFINDEKNWRCINILADYILNCDKDVVSCEEAMEVINNACKGCQAYSPKSRRLQANYL